MMLVLALIVIIYSRWCRLLPWHTLLYYLLQLPCTALFLIVSFVALLYQLPKRDTVMYQTVRTFEASLWIRSMVSCSTTSYYHGTATYCGLLRPTGPTVAFSDLQFGFKAKSSTNLCSIWWWRNRWNIVLITKSSVFLYLSGCFKGIRRSALLPAV